MPCRSPPLSPPELMHYSFYPKYYLSHICFVLLRGWLWMHATTNNKLGQCLQHYYEKLVPKKAACVGTYGTDYGMYIYYALINVRAPFT